MTSGKCVSASFGDQVTQARGFPLKFRHPIFFGLDFLVCSSVSLPVSYLFMLRIIGAPVMGVSPVVLQHTSRHGMFKHGGPTDSSQYR